MTHVRAPGCRFDLPDLGFGLGLRTVHYGHILANKPHVDWFEIISENYMDSGGRPIEVLEEIAANYPIVMHGVSLSIGSADPLDQVYLRRLKALADKVEPHWISDHLCWTGHAHLNSHDLLPVPLTEESLAHIIARIRTVQDILGRPLVLENPSTYVTFTSSSMPECEFLSRMAEGADCGLLLDVNNVYVSSYNHGFNAEAYVRAIPHERVVQYHLAGHTNYGTHIIDTHSDRVIDEVWELYRLATSLTGPRSTLLEWDQDIPEFDEVHQEALKAKRFLGYATDQAPQADEPVSEAAAATPNRVHELLSEGSHTREIELGGRVEVL
ncbi:MAG: MNIO family bufferin maturase [Planctomycetota bacterium]|jgi:uncharacterized protein (UPF0276 family)